MPHRRPSRRPLSALTASAPTPKGSGLFHRLFARMANGSQSAVRPRSYGIEMLEERRMLTVLNDYGTGMPATFNYYSGEDQNIQISYFDVNMVVKAAFVNASNGMITLGNLAMAATPTEPALGGDIYTIDITESNADSFVSIYVISDLILQTPEPYAGSVPGFLAESSLGTPHTVAVPAGTGGVLLGAINPFPVPGPVFVSQIPGTNTSPSIVDEAVNATTGLPNNFGNFLFAGTVTGSVKFGGDVNEFYAGSVLTGNINGDQFDPQATGPQSARPHANSFFVAGDLREFLTAGPVGTDGPFGAQNNPDYITNFDLNVEGKIGEVHIGNNEQGTPDASFAGTIEAGNSPYISQQIAYPVASVTNVIGNATDQTEVETLATPNPDAVFAEGEVDLRNDTPADAQILGSIPELDAAGLPVRDLDGKIIYYASVDGNVDTPPDGDGDDYYAVPLLGGVTFTVTLTYTMPEDALVVFDPDGREIATDSNSVEEPVQITTTEPGLYLFEVTPVGGVGEPYNLTITGVGNMGIGGIEVKGTYDDIGIDSGIICGNGDLGTLDVGSTYISTTVGPAAATSGSTLPPIVTPPVSAPSSIVVPDGNLRVLSAAGGIGLVNGSTTGSSGPLVNDNFVMIDGPYLSIPNGSVGLVVSSGGPVVLNSQFDPNFLDDATSTFVTDDQYASAIGGFIEKISAATEFQGDIATNAGIGTIQAANMATTPVSYIDVNADDKGEDGIIDLIDVTGPFGNLANGGPEIVTGPGGDVRYLDLNPSDVYRDEFFGGGGDTNVVYPAGQAATFTDQTGNVVTVTPVGPVTTTTTTVTNTPSTNTTSGVSTIPTTSTTTVTTGPQIQLLTYQIRDKAGLAPIGIGSIGGGLTITTSGTSVGTDQVNIGLITVQSANGSPVVPNTTTDEYGNLQAVLTPTTLTAATNDGTTTTSTTNADGSTTVTTTTIEGGGVSTSLSAVLGGTAKINVLQFTAYSTGDPAFVPVIPIVYGNLTLLQNNTTGEVASVRTLNAGQIITHGNLGYTTPVATPTADVPTTVITNGNAYPFVQQHTGVVVGSDTTLLGYAVDIDSYGGIGNINVYGTVDSISANYGISAHTGPQVAIAGQYDGVVGPIVAGDIGVPIPLGTYGSILSIDIGQGVLPTGTGLVGFAGIYASGSIGLVDNIGNPNGDIRGDVVAEDDDHFEGDYVPGEAIGAIDLNHASIIDAAIDVWDNWNGTNFYDALSAASPLGLPDVHPEPNQTAPFTNPYVYEIGAITVTGAGGIIGADIESADVGEITVTGGGFGVLETLINSQDIGRVAGIVASGYGIRDTTVTQCGYLGAVVTTGSGADVSVLSYPIDVRESDIGNQVLDPFFGVLPDADTDLNFALGTSALTPNIPNVTDTGVIQDCVFEGQESFAGLSAQKVRTAMPLITYEDEPNPDVVNIPQIGVDFPMEINFGNSIGNIRIFQVTDGLELTTGHLVGFSPSGSINRVGISVNGTINALVIKGTFGKYFTNPLNGQIVPDSYINAGGASGTIGTLRVLGNMNANVYATGQINNMIVTGDLLGGVTCYGSTTSLALGSLHVYGGLRDGSLDLNGNVGSIIINGTLGTSTGTLGIAGSANLIEVGANRRNTTADFALAMSVGGTVRDLVVYGQMTGSATIGLDLTKLTIIGNGSAPNILSGDITVGGRIGNALIVNGNVSSIVSAVNSIGTFTIRNGSLLEPAIVESTIAGIGNFNIVGGPSDGLYGSLLAPSGTNDNINVSGNIGDTANPATLTALSGNNFIVHGTISDFANISVTGQLNLLQVNGNIQTGAFIAAHPLVKEKIKGTNTGTIIIV